MAKIRWGFRKSVRWKWVREEEFWWRSEFEVGSERAELRGKREQLMLKGRELEGPGENGEEERR